MARITKPLNNTEVSQAKPREKEYTLFDGDGLTLRVKSNGSKSWLFNYYKPITKKRANLGIGSYPSITLSSARKKRDEYRALLERDIDPKAFKEKQLADSANAFSNTMESIAGRWFKVKATSVSIDYGEDIWRSLSLHVFPSVGKLPVDEVKAPLIIKTLEPLVAKGNLETLKRVSQRLNEIMDYAVNTGVIDANPLSGIGKAFAAPKKKHLPALKPDELPELMHSLKYARVKVTTLCVIEWQLHTMVRPSEAAGTRWDELDLDSKLWHIPAERMKAKRPHTVPLTDQAIALLKIMEPISRNRDYVFPSDRSPRMPINEQTANMAIKRMGYEGRLVAHGLRSLASTTLNEQGFDADLIEVALAHVDKNEVRRAYNRAEYIERRREMMGWWSNRIVASQ